MAENRTILIVDDEPETLKGYAEFLAPFAGSTPTRRSSRRGAGDSQDAVAPGASIESYNLLLAESGEKAVEIVKNEMAAGRRVAAGFFDVKLEGGMDGLQTIQVIKAMDKDLRCVVVTAYHDRSVQDIHQLFGEEFKDHWDYLNKPFSQGEIVQKARQMIGIWNRDRMLQAMQKQLVKSERLAGIGQVARGVGHEFGNILLRIVGKTDLALMEKDIAKCHEHLGVVMTAAERAGVIVRNLQSFSRTEPNFQKSSIGRPIEESLSLMSHEFVKASVKVEKDIQNVPQLRIDVGGLGQVLLNLMINATHAMPKGGLIKLKVEEATGPEGKRGVALRVADTGTGIPESVLPRIFDFAFTTKGDQGSGIGLAISKEIIEAHGGELSVRTEMDKGTEFTIWLPAIAEGTPE